MLLRVSFSFDIIGIMRQARILLILGVRVTILPYLGFPSAWKNILFTLTGLGLIYLSFILYKGSKAGETAKQPFDNFKENSDFSKNEMSFSDQLTSSSSISEKNSEI